MFFYLTFGTSNTVPLLCSTSIEQMFSIPDYGYNEHIFHVNQIDVSLLTGKHCSIESIFDLPKNLFEDDEDEPFYWTKQLVIRENGSRLTGIKLAFSLLSVSLIFLFKELHMSLFVSGIIIFFIQFLIRDLLVLSFTACGFAKQVIWVKQDEDTSKNIYPATSFLRGLMLLLCCRRFVGMFQSFVSEEFFVAVEIKSF